MIATSQADVAFMEQLEADMSAGNMSAQEFLSSVAGSGMFKKIAIAFAICIALLLWPLQRCIVGTLRAVYALPAAGSSVALHVVAVVIGIIWIVTGGVFGIGWIVDIVTVVIHNDYTVLA